MAAKQSESADRTAERGERTRADPREGSGRSVETPSGGTDGANIGLQDHHNETRDDREQRVRDMSRSDCSTEEPDAVVPHVRICGSRGCVSTRGHPVPPVSTQALQGKQDFDFSSLR